MSVKTKEQLKQDFSDNQTATGAKFADLIDSLKAVQSAVSDPAASGTSITFIATISQEHQRGDNCHQKDGELQRVSDHGGHGRLSEPWTCRRWDDVTVGAGNTQDINHNMKHYPTVRLLDVETRGLEVCRRNTK